MLFSPFEDEVRPGVISTQQELLFTEVTILVLIKQGGQTSLQYPRKNDALKNSEKLLAITTTPGLSSFSMDKFFVILLFSERPIAVNAFKKVRVPPIQ